MPPFTSKDRHDPWWDLDGPTARRERRRKKVLSTLAFFASFGALIGAAFVWAIRLGLAHAAGIHLAP